MQGIVSNFTQKCLFYVLIGSLIFIIEFSSYSISHFVEATLRIKKCAYLITSITITFTLIRFILLKLSALEEEIMGTVTLQKPANNEIRTII